MRKWIIGLAIMVAATLPSRVFAHEGHEHGVGKLMGTVTAVHDNMNHVEVKAKDGHVVGFMVDDKTKYMNGDAPATLADLKPGTRVVVTLTGEGEHRTATEVKLSTVSNVDTKQRSSTKSEGNTPQR